MLKKIIIGLLIFILLPNITFATWDDCPFGEEQCQYPGKCGRYTDTNKDEICDHSQQKPEVINEENQTNIASKTTTEKKSSKYPLIPVALILTFLYLVTFFLAKFKIITTRNHQKIWNILLTLSFLISGIFGILLIIKINLGISFNFPFNLLYWHVEFGVVMFVICIFHMLWHWPYYKHIFKFKHKNTK